jgi:hypothetical protein
MSKKSDSGTFRVTPDLYRKCPAECSRCVDRGSTPGTFDKVVRSEPLARACRKHLAMGFQCLLVGNEGTQLGLWWLDRVEVGGEQRLNAQGGQPGRWSEGDQRGQKDTRSWGVPSGKPDGPGWRVAYDVSITRTSRDSSR